MKYDFYITGTIGQQYDWWSGQRGTTAQDVRNFLDQNKDKEVTIAVSSPGGYLDEGIAICELIASHGKCNMVIVGMTASAATVLCMKAKTVKIAQGSLMLIHNSSYMLDVWTSANKQGIDAIIEEFRKQRDELDTFDKAIASIYSTRNKKSIEDNMAMMDKEKWMLAEEAVEFGIVDAILDDDDESAHAKAVKASCRSMNGFAQHYYLPEIPVEEAEKKGLFRQLRDKVAHVMGVLNNVSAEDSTHVESDINNNFSNIQNSSTMKTVIFNLICGVLALTAGFTLNEKGEAALTEDQLKALEDAFKAKDDALTKSMNDLKLAEEAKAQAEKAQKEAEDKLKQVQDEFDKFKQEAGDDTGSAPPQSESEPVTSATMYNKIKDLL